MNGRWNDDRRGLDGKIMKRIQQRYVIPRLNPEERSLYNARSAETS
jgi:hypothetical protein